MNWAISAKRKIYRCHEAFEKLKVIDWRANRTKYSVGDIVYIYCSAPIQKIMFKCVVEKINIKFEDTIDDREFWVEEEKYLEEGRENNKFVRLRLIKMVDKEELSFENLKENGLNYPPQGPRRLPDETVKYVEKFFNDDNDYLEEVFPDEIKEDEEEELLEGLGIKVIVNKYERNKEARRKCIEEKGVSCSICGINFEETYGEVGKGFIHVHHIKPLYEINKEYKVDYKKDLIPVCPNCHGMLHRKINGRYLTPEELKEVLDKNKK